MKQPEEMSRNEMLDTLCAANHDVARAFWDTFLDDDLVIQIKSLRRAVIKQAFDDLV